MGPVFIWPRSYFVRYFAPLYLVAECRRLCPTEPRRASTSHERSLVSAALWVQARECSAGRRQCRWLLGRLWARRYLFPRLHHGGAGADLSDRGLDHGRALLAAAGC